MSAHAALGLAAVGALAAVVAEVIVYRRYARLARRYRAALEQVGFWTGAWIRDTRHLLRVCDEQAQQVTTLNESIDTLQHSLERARRQARAQKQKEHATGAAPKPRRRGRTGVEPPA